MLLSAVKNKHARDDYPDILVSCQLHMCCVFNVSLHYVQQNCPKLFPTVLLVSFTAPYRLDIIFG